VTRIRGQGRNYLRRSRPRIAAWRHAITTLAVAVALAAPAAAQEKKKAPPKKPAIAKPVAHGKASPEQIRKFNELAKKRHQQL